MSRGVVESEPFPPFFSLLFSFPLSPLNHSTNLHTTTLTPHAHLVHEDPPPTPTAQIHDLESENAALHRKVQALEREFQCRSPTKSQSRKPKPKSKVLETYEAEAGSSDVENVGYGMGGMRLDDGDTDDKEVGAVVTKTPKTTQKKKVRKLTTRKWDLGLEIEGSSP